MAWGTTTWGSGPWGKGDTTGPVIEMSPSDGAVRVPVDTLIRIDITDPSGVDQTSVTVSLSGTALPAGLGGPGPVLAFDGSSVGTEFQSGFDDVFSSIAVIPNGIRITIDPTQDLDEGVLTVIIAASDTLGLTTNEIFFFSVSTEVGVTPFDYEPGSRQLRAEPARATAQEGSYVFILGSDAQNEKWPLAIGDKVEILQSVDVTSVNFIRLKMQLVGPAVLPADRKWVATFRLNAAARGQFDVVVGTNRSLKDLTANVSALTGNQSISVDLEVAAA